MKKIEIEIPDGKEAKWVNCVLTLVDVVEETRPITERVKTFDDACAVLGENHPLVLQYKYNFSNESGWDSGAEDLEAYLKLRIITAALNEGWEPKFTTDEWRWYPWFRLLTKSDIEELSEEEKCRVVGRANNNANAYGGLVYANAGYVSSSLNTNGGSRLAFKSEELADYAGTQFAEIYANFCFIPQ